MRVLLIYGTNTSGTYEAGTIVRDVFMKHHHTVTLKPAKDVTAQTLKRYDAVIFGSCTWDSYAGKERHEGQLQQDMEKLSARLRKITLEKKPVAVFGLGDSHYTYFCRAATYLEELVKVMKARKIGSTLRVNRYYHTMDANRMKVRRWAGRLAQRFTKLAAA